MSEGGKDWREEQARGRMEWREGSFYDERMKKKGAAKRVQIYETIYTYIYRSVRLSTDRFNTSIGERLEGQGKKEGRAVCDEDRKQEMQRERVQIYGTIYTYFCRRGRTGSVRLNTSKGR